MPVYGPVQVAIGDAAIPGAMPEVAIGAFSGSVMQRLQTVGGAAGGNGVGLLGAGLMGFDGANYFTPRLDSAGDGIIKVLGAAQYGYNGTNEDRVRIPQIFNTITATAAGDTALWTPANGKKFRLMGFLLLLTQNAAQSVAGLIEIVLRDGINALPFGLSVYVPGAAGTVVGSGDNTGFIPLGNGKLSAVAGNVLNLNLSAALTAGEVRAMVLGTEE